MRNHCVTHSPVEALAALADPTRRELVALLARGELAAGELADRFPVSRPAISRHLRVLREAGLVRVRSEGRRRLYALDPRPLAELDDWVEQYRDRWAQGYDALDTELDRGRRRKDPLPPHPLPVGGGPLQGGRRGGPTGLTRASPPPAASSSPWRRTAGSASSSAARGPTRSRRSGR